MVDKLKVEGILIGRILRISGTESALELMVHPVPGGAPALHPGPVAPPEGQADSGASRGRILPGGRGDISPQYHRSHPATITNTY